MQIPTYIVIFVAPVNIVLNWLLGEPLPMVSRSELELTLTNQYGAPSQCA